MIKRTLSLLSLVTLVQGILTAQTPEPITRGLDDRINDAFAPVADFIGSIVFFPVNPGSPAVAQLPAVVVLLLTAATIFTVYFGFIQFRSFRFAARTVAGDYEDLGDKVGEVTHFQALTAALSGTVGLGNIAGVAVAISLGGPGATFWMIMAGLLGMASKFAECTLGVRYRDVSADGTIYGGPMYYLRKGLSGRDMGGLGKVLAVVFSIFCVGGSFGGGNMFQANQAASQFNAMIGATSGSAGLIFGLVLAALVGLVIIGGIKRIGSVTERVVPAMCGLYVLAALIVIFANFGQIPAAVNAIFSGAFTAAGISGGFVGVLVQGFRRAAFSNEAGVGSAAIAHSAVKTNYAASEGIVALLEPFIDTVVVCTITALVIIIASQSGDLPGFAYGAAGNDTLDGVQLTSTAFGAEIPWFPYVLTVAVVLFAFSTQLSWSYYGLQAWLYLFGRSKRADLSYKILFLIFVVIGSSASLGAVISFSDAMIFAMCVPNLIGVMLLLPVVKDEIAKYRARARAVDAAGGREALAEQQARALSNRS